jgi:hypothetical protein
MNTIPLWVPLVVAGLGLIGAVGGVIITQKSYPNPNTPTTRVPTESHLISYFDLTKCSRLSRLLIARIRPEFRDADARGVPAPASTAPRAPESGPHGVLAHNLVKISALAACPAPPATPASNHRRPQYAVVTPGESFFRSK